MQTAIDRAEQGQAVLRGALWMLASAAFLAVANSLVRILSEDLHVFQLALLGNAAGLLLLAPALRAPVPAEDRRRRRSLYTILALCGGTTALAWYYALAHVPLAEATAMSFAAPLLASLLAAVLLKERLTPRTRVALGVGFLGTLLIARPGAAPLDADMLILAGATLGMAAMYVLTKMISGLDSTLRITALLTLAQVAICAGPAIAVWRTPAPETLAWAGLMAVAMLAGRMAMVRAFSLAPVSSVMPLDFARLPFVAVIAMVTLGEVPPWTTWVGGALVMAASMAVLRKPGIPREAAGIRS